MITVPIIYPPGNNQGKVGVAGTQFAEAHAQAFYESGDRLAKRSYADAAVAALEAANDIAIAAIVADMEAADDALTAALAAHTGNVTNPHGVTAAQLGLGNVTSNLAAHTGNTSNPHGVTAAQVGLGNITSDLAAHTGNTSNPHAVTKAQVGLGNVTDVNTANATNITSGTLAPARGGLGIDASALTLGTMLVVNANGTISAIQSSTDGHVPMVQANGTIAFESVWSNPMTTLGDIIVAGANGTPARLPIGANGTRLGVVAGNLTYIAPHTKGYQWIGAGAMAPRGTNGAAIGNMTLAGNNIKKDTFDFDPTTEEGVNFDWSFPDGWDSGTIKFRVFWSAISGSSGNVTWGLRARASGDNEVIDSSYGTEQLIIDAFQNGNRSHITDASGELTIGNTPAPLDLIQFEITRETGNASDNLGVDAKLIGIKIEYGLSATAPTAW